MAINPVVSGTIVAQQGKIAKKIVDDLATSARFVRTWQRWQDATLENNATSLTVPETGYVRVFRLSAQSQFFL
jgi:hypothetical protein